MSATVTKRKRKAAEAQKTAAALSAPWWMYPAAIVVCVLVFYWTPLTASNASIQWDAADMHYPLQRYWSDHLRAGSMPFWTPYLFCGYPFMANPEVAAWYPPHWPFFLAGVTPWTIQAEIAITALIACLGGFVFLLPLVRNRAAAVLGGLAYGLSGFFAGHASHVGLAAAAAWLPWLLAAYRRAMEGSTWRFAALGAAAGACMLLAGYFQTAMYGFLALGLYAIGDGWAERRKWGRAAAVVAVMLAGAVGLAGVQVLPGLELTAETGRAAGDWSTQTEGVLHAAPLATLVAPDALGAMSEKYTGPADVTQYYWYAGLLLVPLAGLGAVKSGLRMAALAMVIPALWYMAGPAGGLYRIGAIVPGLHKVRAPIQGWFVVALGLAMLAAAGTAWAAERWRHWTIAPALIALLFVDVWANNSAQNPLAYARASFAELYGQGEGIGRQVAQATPPLTRFDEPQNGLSLGPRDHALDLRMETTSGYFALEPRRTVEYMQAAASNPKLRAGANVSRTANLTTGALETVAGTLPRAYFPKAVRATSDTRGALAALDPAAESMVDGAPAPERQDGAATASVSVHDEGRYRISYRAASPSLLKLTESWFPGWHARSGGSELPVLRVDHAFMGVVVPAGAGEVEFEYRPNYFGLGLALSLATAAALTVVAFRFPGAIR